MLVKNKNALACRVRANGAKLKVGAIQGEEEGRGLGRKRLGQASRAIDVRCVRGDHLETAKGRPSELHMPHRSQPTKLRRTLFMQEVGTYSLEMHIEVCTCGDLFIPQWPSVLCCSMV